MKKPLFVFLFAAGVTASGVPVAWLVLSVLGKGNSSLVVLVVTALVGIGGGAFIGARIWEDRQVLRQRAAQENEEE
ncbi:hypothetical protein [Paenarthrobacter sp. JL.01a]|uniref:hypothetical protein n=1 Tax=Paenarthrobacter sp. JL.01a TaxID=2979324 RepID=UPI0021C77484|nr:hypothetical protein [Paenarthrobacter sp. JL.01a]UXM90791.1 hypothetical protein N5P29_16050 [Paenarthrobacter sp. JL.01a]